MNLDATNQPAEERMPPTEPTSLPQLPWKEGIEVVLARYERRILDHALAQSNGVKRRAAMLLGISRYALERRLTRVARTLTKADEAAAAAANPTPLPRAEEKANSVTGEGS